MPAWSSRSRRRAAAALSASDPAAGRRAVERWFVRRGLPHFIHNYSASEDVWTRAIPVLFVLYLLGALDASSVAIDTRPDVGDELQLAVDLNLPLLLVGLLVIAGPWMYLNRREGRPLLSRPRRVGRRELAAFVIVPALLSWLGTRDATVFAWAIAGNLVVLGLIYVVTSYALVRLTRWVFARMITQTAIVLGLVVRALPLLMVIIAVLLLTTEVWQAAGTLREPGYPIALVLLLGAAFLFLTTTLAREVRRLQAFDSWDDVDAALVLPRRDLSLLALLPAPSEDRPVSTFPPLTRRQRANAALVMLVNQMIQIGVVSLVTGVFLTVFGLFAVPRQTVQIWVDPVPVTTLASVHLGSAVFELTEPLLRVTGFITAFMTLFLSVAALTDETYRREFYADTENQLRLAFAVRLRYLSGLVDP